MTTFACCRFSGKRAEGAGMHPSRVWRELYCPRPGERGTLGHALAYNLGNFLRTFATGADQDWREGREPRPLCRLPDGRGRHSEKPFPRHPAADRRTPATAGHVNSMRRTASRVSSQNNGDARLDDRPFAVVRLAGGRSGAYVYPTTRCPFCKGCQRRQSQPDRDLYLENLGSREPAPASQRALARNAPPKR
jgi:hypothetical protein